MACVRNGIPSSINNAVKKEKRKKEVTEKKCFLSKTQSLKTIMFESGENNEKRR